MHNSILRKLLQIAAPYSAAVGIFSLPGHGKRETVYFFIYETRVNGYDNDVKGQCGCMQLSMLCGSFIHDSAGGAAVTAAGLV